MSESFATLLRRYRVAAALTQERLAEEAGISATGLAALERGRRRAPRLSTVRLIADALALTDDDRAALSAAAAASADTERAISRPSLHGGDQAQGVPSMERPPSRFGLIGRGKELQRLRVSWENRSRLTLLFGEEGIGKTRLAGELAQEAEASGVPVLWGRCPSEQLGPYEPFIAVARHVVVHLPEPRWEAVVGKGELVRLVPELATLAPNVPAPTQADPGTQRRLLFESFTRLIGAMGYLLLVIDDLHWADSASLALLDHIVRQPELSHVAIIGTVRTTGLDDAHAAVIADIGRDTTVARIVLGNLEVPEIAVLVEQVVGDVPPRELVQMVTDAAGGNPFYIQELTEHLLESGISARAGPTPARVRETISRRVSCLSPDARVLLRSGSVLGREFEPGLAASLADLDDTRTINAAEDALLSGLVVEASPRTIAFSHGLVQSTIYRDLSSLRRAQIHRRAATEFEQRAAPDGAHVADIARHWAAVAEVDDSALASAARWAVRAGDAALAVAATDEAISRYEQATRWWAVSTADHADALIRLGNALLSSGRGSEADDRFRSALTLADALDDATLRTRAALGLGATIHFGQVDTERITALEAGIAKLGTEDRALRIAAETALMRLLAFDRSPAATARRTQLDADILAAVDRPGATPDILMAVGGARDATAVSDPEALDRITKRIIAVAGERRDLTVLANAWYGQAWSALERADAEDWWKAVEEYSDTASLLQLPFELSVAAMLRAAAAQIEGRYAEARELVRQARIHGEKGSDPNISFVASGHTMLLGIDQGRAPTMLGKMQDPGDTYAEINISRSGLALVAALAGDETQARSVLDEFAQSAFTIRHDSEWPATVAFLSHACALLDDAQYAAPLREVVVAANLTAIRVAPVAGWWGPVDHHVGALCRVLSDLGEARGRLERAIEKERALRALPFEARTKLELAHVLDLLGRSHDQGAVSALREDAVAIADRLGAHGIVAEAQRRDIVRKRSARG